MENSLEELTYLVRQLAVAQNVQSSAPQINKSCEICCDPLHSTDACPTLQESTSSDFDPSVAVVGAFSGNPYQQNFNPFSNSYNAGWNQNQQQYYFPYQQRQVAFLQPMQQVQQQQPAPSHPVQQQQTSSGPSLEELIKQFAVGSLQFQQHTESILQTLQTQIGQLATSLSKPMVE